MQLSKAVKRTDFLSNSLCNYFGGIAYCVVSILRTRNSSSVSSSNEIIKPSNSSRNATGGFFQRYDESISNSTTPNWDWDAYAYTYSKSAGGNVGIREKNKYWNGRYKSFPKELKRLYPDTTDNPVWGMGECRANVIIWHEV